ncbi:helix-turn-helix domain-containing protein [Streptomyces sp. NPDC055992]|uniref:helix-turn-helix domain-containing protein n=1 Tax=Streptomyces sp. NPDC055992 TaxID=3345673 RepID=UPI0035E3897F
MPVSVTTADGRAPDGDVVTHRLGAVTVSAIASGAQYVSHAPVRWPGVNGPDLVVLLHTHGSTTYRWRGDDVLAGPTVLLMHDSAQRCSLSYEGPFTAFVLRVPARVVGLSAEQLGPVAGTALPTTGGTAALLASLLPAVTSAAGWAPRVGERLGAALVDLVTLLVLEHGASETVQEGPRGELVRRVRAYIDQHYRDPSLSPESIAKAHHVSLRYLHRVFEPEELTVGRLIQRRRLEEGARELARPGRRAVTVAAVAQLCGFTNAAHLSRAFRRLHGCPPLEWRSRALGRSGAPGGAGRVLARPSVAGR